MTKVLIATDKPFAPVAVNGIREIVEAQGYELVLLEKYTSQDELIAAVADVDAMIIRSDKATKEVIEAAKNLKVIVRAGAGYDNIDLAACTAHNVVAMNTPGQNSNAVAGQTSPYSSKCCKASTIRRASSTLRPNGKSLIT